MARFRTALAARIDHWVHAGVFQLQRRAFETQAQRCWVQLEQEIPITLEHEKLRELPVDSSLALKAVDRRFAKKTRLRKTGTSGTIETLAGADEADLQAEGMSMRPSAGTDTMTLVSVVMEKGEFKKLKKLKSGDSK